MNRSLFSLRASSRTFLRHCTTVLGVVLGIAIACFLISAFATVGLALLGLGATIMVFALIVRAITIHKSQTAIQS